MAISCENKVIFGSEFCLTDCPLGISSDLFQYHRAKSDENIPPADERIIDVAVLDMNHGWPNLGHDSVVQLVQDTACDFREMLKKTGLKLRVISYDVRLSGLLPPKPGDRFRI